MRQNKKGDSFRHGDGSTNHCWLSRWRRVIQKESYPKRNMGDPEKLGKAHSWSPQGSSPTPPLARLLESNPSTKKNHKKCGLTLKSTHHDWDSSVADAGATENIPRVTGKMWQSAHLSQQRKLTTFSKCGKHSRLNNSPTKLHSKYLGLWIH